MTFSDPDPSWGRTGPGGFWEQGRHGGTGGSPTSREGGTGFAAKTLSPGQGGTLTRAASLTSLHSQCQATQDGVRRLLKREQVPPTQAGARPGPGHKQGCTLGSGHPGRSSRGVPAPTTSHVETRRRKTSRGHVAGLSSPQLAPRVNIPMQEETDSSRQEKSTFLASGCPALALGARGRKRAEHQPVTGQPKPGSPTLIHMAPHSSTRPHTHPRSPTLIHATQPRGQAAGKASVSYRETIRSQPRLQTRGRRVG